MKIVIASRTAFSSQATTGLSDLTRELTNQGHDVLHIAPPGTSLLSPVKASERLTSITPRARVPWRVARVFLTRWNLFVLGSNLESTFNNLGWTGEVDVLLVEDPRFVGLEKLLRPKALYYCATDLSAASKADATLTTAERLLLPQCSGVMAPSRPVLNHVLTLKPGMHCLLLADSETGEAPSRERQAKRLLDFVEETSQSKEVLHS